MVTVVIPAPASPVHPQVSWVKERGRREDQTQRRKDTAASRGPSPRSRSGHSSAFTHQVKKQQYITSSKKLKCPLLPMGIACADTGPDT